MADLKEPLNKPAAKEDTPLVAPSPSAEEPSTASALKEQLMIGAAIVMLVGIAVLKTQLTAYLFQSADFPTAYSLWSCIVTCAILVPCFFAHWIPTEKIGLPKITPQWGYPSLQNKQMCFNLLMIVFFTALDLGFTNIALSLISTALQQCVASTNPFWTIMIETILYKKFQHYLIYIIITSLVIGAVLAALSNFAGINAAGFICACVAVLCSSTKYVFAHKAFKEFKDQMGAVSLLFWVDILMIPIYLIWAGANGEIYAMFDQLDKNPVQWGAFTGTAALGGVRALTQYIVLVMVTATSMSTANIFTQILNILIALMDPNAPHRPDITPTLIAGVAIVIVFAGLYTFVKTYKQALPMWDKAFPWCAPEPKKKKESKPEESKPEEATASAPADKV